MTKDKSGRMVGLLVPRQRRGRGGNCGAELLTDRTRRLHMAGWIQSSDSQSSGHTERCPIDYL